MAPRRNHKDRVVIGRMMSETFISGVLKVVEKMEIEKKFIPKSNYDVQLLSLVEQDLVQSPKEEEKPPLFDIFKRMGKLEPKSETKEIVPGPSKVEDSKESVAEPEVVVTKRHKSEPRSQETSVIPDVTVPEESVAGTSKADEPAESVAITAYRNRPFIPTPFCLGYDFTSVQRALKERMHLAKNKRRKAMGKNELPPLSSYLRPRKNLLANAKSPVPPNYVLTRRPIPSLPGVPQIQEVSSSTVEEEETVIEQEITNEEKQQFSYLIHFNEVCCDFVTKLEGCDATNCNHELPAANELEWSLEGNMCHLRDTYNLVKKFNPELRKEYLPLMAVLFAENRINDLEVMTKEISVAVPFIGFGIINDALLAVGWSACDAVRFIVDHHKETEKNRQKVRSDILGRIGTLKEDVIKFVDYLTLASDTKV